MEQQEMTDTSNLEDGFYWVRSWENPCKDQGAFEAWEIAYKDGDEWLYTGSGATYGKPVEIDPRPIKREDVK